LERKRVAIVTSFFRLGQWRGIMRCGQKAGWICQRHDRDSLDRLAAWKPDGVLFQVDEYEPPLLEWVRNCEVPKVGLRALLGHEEQTPLVLPDLAGFGKMVAHHFLASNYRRLCYLGPSSDETSHAACTHARGMREVAESRNIELECIFPDRPATWKALGLPYRRSSPTGWDRFWELGPAMIDHLILNPEPVGIFSAFVEPAMELLEMIDERHIDIPRQIGMVAQTEDGLTGMVTKVPLTCIVPDYECQGFEAARLLDRMLNGEEIPANHRKFVSTCEFISRESSNQIVTSDTLVRDMLEHIRKHALRFDYTPAALAEAYDYSLRLVQIRFRKALGRGVAEIIREHRTNHAAELIRRTKLPMQEIVTECGFSDHHQLERAVKKAFGMNPSSLRRSGSQPK
jgi:LacI family transcriptional regulator